MNSGNDAFPIPHVRNFIRSEWLESTSGERLELISPIDGEVYGSLPRSAASDVDRAAESAKGAQKFWQRSSAQKRAELLFAVAQKLSKRAEELAWLEAINTGKPLALAQRMDIPRAIANFNFFAHLLLTESLDAHPMEGALNYTLRQPLGTVALITPWNLPLYLLTWKVAPALAMGNTVICKPSELTPLTAHILAETFAACESEGLLPRGVFQMIHGLGAEVGTPLCAHPDVAAVSFTGGTETGAKVAEAATSFKKISLELGGKNPSVVFADRFRTPSLARKTVNEVLRAAFLNSGQICLCGSRILLEESAFPLFMELAHELIELWSAGHPLTSDARMGSVISHAHLQKLRNVCGTARAAGGEILERPLSPQLPRSGAFMNPVLITGLSHTSDLAQNEHFGPIATVHSFVSEDEAISLANDVRYGLAASVWTDDLGRAHRVAAALQTGMVWVNTWLKRDLRVPFGGVKHSGLGTEGGRRSFDFYSESRNICIEFETTDALNNN